MSIENSTLNPRTPAECYVYRKQNAQDPALQRSAMCLKCRKVFHQGA